jgi:hypothetical protein
MEFSSRKLGARLLCGVSDSRLEKTKQKFPLTPFVQSRLVRQIIHSFTGHKLNDHLYTGEEIKTANEVMAFKFAYTAKRRLFFCSEGPRSRCYGRTTALRLFVQPYDEDEDEQFFYQVLQVMEHRWNEIDRGKRTTRRKTCPSATLSTTNPTCTDPGSNPGLRSERPATNRLKHGTAQEDVRGV